MSFHPDQPFDLPALPPELKRESLFELGRNILNIYTDHV